MEKNYHIEDFTEVHYKELLYKAKHRFRFAFYREEPSDNKAFWRHDVDYSPERALRIAEIERDAGVRSTFFFQTGSLFYSILEDPTAELIRSIAGMGHDIGLHFDPAAGRGLALEKGILEVIAGRKVEAFSLHNPDKTSIDNHTEHVIEGMVNAYSEIFRKSCAYCSDSNGYWRHRRLADFLYEESGSIQVLTHPVWWQDKPMMPRERIVRCAELRRIKCMEWYDSFLYECGRENVR
ncbi:hypothetical protein [Limisalsivibrio acetivorans]|uniref:hypothetical protein n=1 Tax=Limisalsivibrio acetivorans TaxID=1304888 RepID=UPI00138AEFAD|nr:hypothetical protein [Limisalsivibrio acetivorans]